MGRSKVLPLGVGVLLALAGRGRADAPKELPPAPKGFDAPREGVAQGKVETVEYDSRAVGAKRKMVIYTPPGYSPQAKYPVLYLLHGAGDDETGWLKKGSAQAILDNLAADKKVRPMIVVMPNGFARKAGGPAAFGPGGKGRFGGFPRPGQVVPGFLEDALKLTAEQKKQVADLQKEVDGRLEKILTADQRKQLQAMGRRGSGGFGPPGFGGRGGGFGGPGRTSAFEDDLLKDVLPYVEAHYAVQADRGHRALAGLSMGGGQALTIGLKHPETFAWVGGFSSALFGGQAGATAGVTDAGKKLRLLWLSCGDKDSLMKASQSLHAALEAKGVRHVWHVDSGGHTWPVWRNDLYLLAQMLFRDEK
jgi:enterochelin esterase-like enzyme